MVSLDNWIEAISPGWALKRAQSRARLDNYRINTDKNLRTKALDIGGPNNVANAHQAKLRNWGRHLQRNSPTVAAIIRELALRTSHYQVAPQIKDRAGNLAEKANAEIGRAYRLWADVADHQGAMCWAQMRQLQGEHWVRDGEVLALTTLGSARVSYASDIPLTIQTLESDFLPVDKSAVDDPRIVQGVELNKAAQEVAYHLYRSHPKENIASLGETFRMPKEKTILLRNIVRAGQVRGLSMLAPSDETVADVDDYLASERIAMKFASAIGLKVTKDPDFKAPVLDSDGNENFTFAPGMTWRGAPGEDIGMLNIDRPGNSFEPYLRQMQRQAAAGVGVNYSAMSNDFSGSYSSQRQMLVTAQAWYDQLQCIQVRQIEERVYQAFLQGLTLAGQMPSLRGIDERTLTDVDFIPPAMPWIDPLREVQADIALVDNALESRQGVIRKRGGSVERINREREQNGEPANATPTRAA